MVVSSQPSSFGKRAINQTSASWQAMTPLSHARTHAVLTSAANAEYRSYFTAAMSSQRPRVVSREPLSPDEAKWTRLVKVTYEDNDGVGRVWESAERTTRPPPLYEGHVPVDGVDIVAILSGDEPHIILIRQFRPAVGRVVIEVPAGLVDAGETVEEAAIRELREETGYIGTLSTEDLTTPELFPDPGLGSTNLKVVHLTVDRADPANQNPVAQLEEGELVQEVFTVPLVSLYTTCRQLDAEGYAIDSRVGTLAEGMEMARRFSLFSK